jgi:hypothetical protein
VEVGDTGGAYYVLYVTNSRFKRAEPLRGESDKFLGYKHVRLAICVG